MQDQIDLSQALIVASPDVRSWKQTADITHVWFDGAVTRVDFTKKDGADRWPDVPFGQPGDSLQYTLWLFRKIKSQWVGAAFIEFWYGRDGSGSVNDPDVPTLYDQHWFYGTAWAPLNEGGKIQPGEQIGFMVSTGNCRLNGGPFGSMERSNVVLFAAQNVADYTFAAGTPQTEPSGLPTVPTPPPPVEPQGVDYLTADELHTALGVAVATINAHTDQAKQAILDRIDQVVKDAEASAKTALPLLQGLPAIFGTKK